MARHKYVKPAQPKYKIGDWICDQKRHYVKAVENVPGCYWNYIAACGKECSESMIEYYATAPYGGTPDTHWNIATCKKCQHIVEKRGEAIYDLDTILHHLKLAQHIAYQGKKYKVNEILKVTLEGDEA